MLKMLNFKLAYCLLKISVYICTHITTIKLNTMKNQQLEAAKQKLQTLKHACINCHPTMKAYYQGQYYNWSLHIKELESK